jgi:hypothetical protein
MNRNILVAATIAACLFVPALAASAGPQAQDAVCSPVTEAFSGTARDLIVPAHHFCEITGSTITRDVIVEEDSFALVLGSTVGRDLVVAGDFAGTGIGQSEVGRDLVLEGERTEAITTDVTIGRNLDARGAGAALHLELTTIGHDLRASRPQTVQTSKIGPDSVGGPVYVGHDATIEGSPDLPFVFDGICALNVGHDFTIANRSVTLGFGIGSNCTARGFPSNTVGHDLVVTGNHALVGVFGPSSLQLVGNHVGHRLVFSHNTAAPGGTLEVSGNTVGHSATCEANDPAVTTLAPNVVDGPNSCG